MDNSSQVKCKTGVILIAHGAPNRVQDIPEFLKNIRGGTPSSREVIQEVASRYELIGGSSPLLEITQEVAKELEQFLNQESGGDEFKIYLGMRNWSPYIRDAVRQVKEDGIERLVAICLAPQYSKWSTERYLKAFNEALGLCNVGDMEIRFITRWPNAPALIDAFVDRYQAAADQLRSNGHSEFHTIFTVHSIPSGSVEFDKDPYVTEYEKTVQGILDRVSISNWHQAYQSQGMIPVPWLEPTVEDTIDKIAEQGGKAALVVPVGFVCDHIEILYDIDIAFKKYAEEKGLHLSRTESLNTSPLFIEALASVVWEHLA